MTELDDLFPEAKERSQKAKEAWDAGIRLKRTYFGHIPECQEVADAFLDEMGWDPNPFTIKQIASGARDFYVVHGNNPALVRKTIQWVRKHEPDFYPHISSPRSIANKARRFSKEDYDSDEKRRRYLNGV